MRYLMIGLLAAWSGVAVAQDQSIDPTYAAKAEEFAKCSGFWSAFSENYESTDAGDAEQIDSLSNGAQLVAWFFIAHGNHGTWAHQWSKGIANAQAVFWDAVLTDELLPSDQVDKQLYSCSALLPEQEKVLNIIRATN